jgi:hypothetical protein
MPAFVRYSALKESASLARLLSRVIRPAAALFSQEE